MNSEFSEDGGLELLLPVLGLAFARLVVREDVLRYRGCECCDQIGQLILFARF